MLRFWLASLKAWNSLTATGRPFSFLPAADRGCKHSAPLAVACPPPGHAPPSNVCSRHHNDDTETGKNACPRLHAARCHMDPVCLAKFREREMVISACDSTRKHIFQLPLTLSEWPQPEYGHSNSLFVNA